MFSGDSIYHQTLGTIHPTTRQFEISVAKNHGLLVVKKYRLIGVLETILILMKCFKKPPFGDFQNTFLNKSLNIYFIHK